MAGWGKDGSFYKDDNELRRADNKWLQQQEQNRLIDEQNKLIKRELQAQTEALKAQAGETERDIERNARLEREENIRAEQILAKIEREERQEKALIDSIWADYRNISSEIEILKEKQRICLYGTKDYDDLSNLIKEKEIKLDEAERFAKFQVNKYYEHKTEVTTNQREAEAKKSVEEVKLIETKARLVDMTLRLLCTFLFSVSLILPVSYIIGKECELPLFRIAVYLVIGYSTFSIILFMIQRRNIKKKYKK